VGAKSDLLPLGVLTDGPSHTIPVTDKRSAPLRELLTADSLRFHRNHVGRIERAERTITFDGVLRLAHALNVNPEGSEETPTKKEEAERRVKAIVMRGLVKRGSCGNGLNVAREGGFLLRLPDVGADFSGLRHRVTH
jgi:hypothetical protein